MNHGLTHGNVSPDFWSSGFSPYLELVNFWDCLPQVCTYLRQGTYFSVHKAPGTWQKERRRDLLRADNSNKY